MATREVLECLENVAASEALRCETLRERRATLNAQLAMYRAPRSLMPRQPDTPMQDLREMAWTLLEYGQDVSDVITFLWYVAAASRRIAPRAPSHRWCCLVLTPL